MFFFRLGEYIPEVICPILLFFSEKTLRSFPLGEYGSPSNIIPLIFCLIPCNFISLKLLFQQIHYHFHYNIYQDCTPEDYYFRKIISIRK